MAGLASIDDLQILMKTSFEADDFEQAELVLEIVSSWARVVSGQQWPDAPAGVPQDVSAVVLQASRREITNPERAISKDMGPFSIALIKPPDGFFYPAELAILRRFRKSGGLRTVSTSRGEDGQPNVADIGFRQYGDGDVWFPFCSADEGYGDVLPWSGG